jgi:hypothetical protein
MNFEGVGLSTGFVGGQTQNFVNEIGIGVVETIDVVGISLVVVVGWEV